MKRLFNEDTEDYNDEGRALDTAIQNAVEPIFVAWQRMGYSLLDMELVAQGAVFMCLANMRILARSTKTQPSRT